MNKMVQKILATCLILVLILALVPASAQEVKAAAGDITADGVTLFEEDFNYSSIGEMNESNPYNYRWGTAPTFENGEIVFKNISAESCIRYHFDDLEIPFDSDGRVSVAIMIEVRYKQTNNRMYCALESALRPDGTDQLSTSYIGYPVEATQASSRVLVSPDGTDEWKTDTCGFYAKNFTTNSFNLVFGARNDGQYFNGTESNEIRIDYIKVSLRLTNTTTGTYPDYYTISNEMYEFLPLKTGYFQLRQDVNGWTDRDIVMGTNAVLDLNGHTLTVPAGKKLQVGTNARIVDTSAEKTGKILIDQGGLVVSNTEHPQLPVYTGDGYIFAEPQLGDTRVEFAKKDVTGFTLHFRPGFGTVGGKNVREEYLDSGNSGITMDAKLTWVEADGASGEYTLACDGMFNAMYLTQTSKGRLQLTGAENYKSISLTIALNSCGVRTVLPEIKFDNEFLHLIAKGTTYFDGAQAHDFVNPAGQEGTWVLDCDLAYTGTNRNHFSFRINSTTQGTFTLFASQYEGSGTKLYTGMNLNATPTHVHMEVDLATGAYQLEVGGTSVASGTNMNLAMALKEATSLVTVEDISGTVLGSDDPTAYRMNDLIIYTKAPAA